jgi:hypothetical protein
MSTTLDSLEFLVREWLRQDQATSFLEPHNRHTRADIEALWKEGNTDELERRMRCRVTLYYPPMLFDRVLI